MTNDLRFAIRGLLKQKAFAVAAILTLASGLGANTAIFSVVNGVLLRPLPYPEPDRIVTLQTAWRSKPARGGNVSGPDFLDWKRQARSFKAMAWFMGQESGVKAGDVGEFAGVYVVTPEFFEVMGVAPVAGRLFNNDESKLNGPNAILVSASFARSHYGQLSAALGRTIRLASQSFPIVGVMPGGFHYPIRNGTKADFWIPASWIGDQWMRSRTAHNFSVVARLKAGVTLEQARGEMRAIAAQLEQAYPDDDKDKLILVNPLRQTMTASSRSTLELLMAAVGVLLLLSCANVANMLLARGTSRSRELALRAALGASRGQIIRQLLVESAVLAVLAGGAGVLIGAYGTDLLAALAGQNLPRIDEVRMDGAVLLFVTLCSAGCVLLFGVAPALQASRSDVNQALRKGSQKGVLGGARSHRMRNALVIAEIGLSLVLTVGAGLLFRTITGLASVHLGFEPEHLIVMSTSVAAKDDAEVRKAAHFYRNLLPQLRAVPGVVAAAGVMGLPEGKRGSNGAYEIEGRGAPGPMSQRPNAGFNVITPQYFAAMKTPLLQGRDFDERDTYEGAGVAIVNRAFVRREFPNGDAVGRRIRCGLDRNVWMTIVGVVGDVRHDNPAREPGPEIYMPYLQHPWYADELDVVIRTSKDPAGIISEARKLAPLLNADVSLKFSTMNAVLADSVFTPHLRSVLMMAFAGLAALLAMAGVYGVMAYTVSQRVSEMGLRAALGASRGDLFRLVLGQTFRTVLSGLVIGFALAVISSRLLQSMLAVLCIALVALVAAFLPSMRAARVDPVEALRAD